MFIRWSSACLVVVSLLGSAGCCLTKCGNPCGCDVAAACGCPDASCGCPDATCGCPDATCGCPDASCGCPDACYDPACGCPDNCGSGVCSKSCDRCPLFGFLGRVLGCEGSNCCGGCSGELYWNEWSNDPPCAADPCDSYGNYAGPSGAYRAPYRSGAPLAEAVPTPEAGPEFEMARRPEPPVQ